MYYFNSGLDLKSALEVCSLYFPHYEGISPCWATKAWGRSDRDNVKLFFPLSYFYAPSRCYNPLPEILSSCEDISVHG